MTVVVDKEKLTEVFGKSKNGNFFPIDNIGVPHPYCITPKHMQGAGMYLGAEQIRKAEKEHGAVCDICKRSGKTILSYDEHNQALLLSCKEEIEDNEELHEYLLRIKELATEKGYEGFAFKKHEEVSE